MGIKKIELGDSATLGDGLTTDDSRESYSATPVQVTGGEMATSDSYASHPLGMALHKHAKSLAVYPAHPLDMDRYTAPATGGEATGGAKPKKAWNTYPTWTALQQDKGAMNEYLAVRSNAIEDPNFDWGPVLAVMQPRLTEDREYIGVANVGADGRTLHVVASAASPTTTKDGTALTFASIPASLVAEYGSKPGLFLFHTHPSSLACCQLPSSHDLAAAIHSGAATQYAGHAVISRYGVFTYGLDWEAYKAIQEANDPQLAKLHYVHDVVAGHESTRSWSPWSIPDYLRFYPRYRLFINSYPSGHLVGDSRRLNLGNLELPADHEIITDYINDIVSHQRIYSRRANTRRRQKQSAAPQLADQLDVSLDSSYVHK